ncbi:MAG TPA: hypothetical protein VE085_13145 [Burkholderiales bacterium]|nr:hypothetical protein [Burkholderiales bacterium]
MMQLARRQGMDMVAEAGAADAWLKLSQPDAASYFGEVFAQRVALFDFALKTLRLQLHPLVRVKICSAPRRAEPPTARCLAPPAPPQVQAGLLLSAPSKSFPRDKIKKTVGLSKAALLDCCWGCALANRALVRIS